MVPPTEVTKGELAGNCGVYAQWDFLPQKPGAQFAPLSPDAARRVTPEDDCVNMLIMLLKIV